MTSVEPSKFAIFGATSAIASATALLLAKQGARLFLIGRDPERTKAVASDIQTRTGAWVDCTAVDLNDTEAHAGLIGLAREKLEGLDGILIAHGVLGDQDLANRDFGAAEQVIRTNFLSAASILTAAAPIFEQQKAGCMVAIGSVAGDRGRQSNYVYGASKGALEIFVQGLRNRMAQSGVQVLLVKPGFVDTPMTRHLRKNPAFASPETIAQGIVTAIRKRKNCVYLPWFWSWIMLGIRNIPEPVFKRMKL